MRKRVTLTGENLIGLYAEKNDIYGEKSTNTRK